MDGQLSLIDSGELHEIKKYYEYNCGDGTEIHQFKYSMTDEHYGFIRAVYAQTYFKGGLFDRIPANVPTNLNNGALGFFEASAVLHRTLYSRKKC